MRHGRNLLAGLASSIWAALVGLIVVPFYLKYLGVEAYGLIGFYVTFQALLQLLDMGMAPTINREVARCSAAGAIGEAGKLLHSLAVMYWAMALVIAVLIFLMAPLIGNYWLQSKQVTPQTLSNAVVLMGLVLASRWPIGLYQGALVGAQRLAISSAVNLVMVTIGAGGAVAVLAFVSPTIEAFFIWQACIGITYAIVMRSAAWRVVGKERVEGFDVDSVRRVLRFSLGVGAISISGLVLTQLDKVILSKSLELESFGKYMLATVLASSVYILILPIFNLVYPRFSSLVAQQRFDELLRYYRMASRWLATLLFPCAILLILLAKPLIGLWTGDEFLAVDVAPLMSLLLVAYALHGVMYMPYALMLAHGDPRPMFPMYVGLIVIMVPLITLLSVLYGAIGGAYAQLSQFVLYLFWGIWITHRHHLKGAALTWLSSDIGVPLLISTLVGVCGYLVTQLMQSELLLTALTGLVCWVVATLLIIYSSRHSRRIIVGYWNEFRYR